MDFLAPEMPEIPEYVDLEKMEYALKVRNSGIIFCRECGATNPRHGFYPFSSSIKFWNNEGRLISRETSEYICNCCHATPKNPCPYCAEEQRTGQPIDLRKEE